MIGWMAGSLAGHDKNKIYIIIEETQDYVLLCDGDIRLLDNPKRKKKKHIQVIKKNIDKDLAVVLQERKDGNSKSNPVTINETIKRAIKLYKQSLTDSKEFMN